jgi:hypothetical protein
LTLIDDRKAAAPDKQSAATTWLWMSIVNFPAVVDLLEVMAASQSRLRRDREELTGGGCGGKRVPVID